MTVLPVVERELRVAARRSQTYWRRSVAALATIGICVWIWFTFARGTPSHERGQVLFATIAGMAFIYCLLAGAGATADCLSEEKREGTLGLLFLTDLRGYDVVLGKLAASSLGCVYRLLAVLPVLSVPLLLGGVTVGEFWRMVLVLSNTLFFSLAAGMLVSAISRDDRRAMSGAFLLVLALAAGPPLVGVVVANWREPYQYTEAFLLSSPGYSFMLAFDSPFNFKREHFWGSLGIAQAAGWLCLVGAGLILPRSWHDRPAAGTEGGILDWLRSLRYGTGERRAGHRARLLEVNPFFWLASRDRLKPHYAFALLAAVAAVWLGLLLKFPTDMLEPFTYLFTAGILHTVFKFWLATEACRALSESRRGGTIELLLSTPLTIREILAGQMLALYRQFFWPVTLVLTADVVMFLASVNNRFVSGSDDWTFLFLAGVIIFVLDLYALAWVGMWMGLISRNANRAAGAALTRILVVPWVAFFAWITLVGTSGVRSGFEEMMLGSWFFIAVVADLFFLSQARTRLLDRFRVVATQRFEPGRKGRLEPPASGPDVAPVMPEQ